VRFLYGPAEIIATRATAGERGVKGCSDRSRHIETFEREKDAAARAAQVTVDVGRGVHVAPNKTPTVKDAGNLWIEACKAQGLEPGDGRRLRAAFAVAS
jgi:hypothetical protein